MARYRLVRPPAKAAAMKGCQFCRHGWMTCANEATTLGRARAAWIRGSGLSFTELRAVAADVLADGIIYPGEIDALTDPAAPVTCFRFAGGQPCFNHPEPFRFLARGREHKYLEDWTEDLAEHLGLVREQVARG